MEIEGEKISELSAEYCEIYHNANQSHAVTSKILNRFSWRFVQC